LSSCGKTSFLRLYLYNTDNRLIIVDSVTLSPSPDSNDFYIAGTQQGSGGYLNVPMQLRDSI